MKIGAQLFTIHEHAKTLEDLEKSLQRIAKIGFHEVQLSGICAYEPQWMKEQLDKNGLDGVITHTSSDRMISDTDALIADHKIFGCNNIGIGYLKITNSEEYQNFVTNFKPVAQKMKDQGCILMYHNHTHEFGTIDGTSILDRMAEDFESDELNITFDTYWGQTAGVDPAQWIRKFKGRVNCLHFKDMEVVLLPEGDHQIRMSPVGNGNMNFDSIIEAAKFAGSQHVLIEQDNCYGADPFDCLETSMKYLLSKGLEL